MMLDQKIREVFGAAKPDPDQLREVINFMQFSLGWNYAQSIAAVKKVLPSFSQDRWEELTYNLDFDL